MGRFRRKNEWGHSALGIQPHPYGLWIESVARSVFSVLVLLKSTFSRLYYFFPFFSLPLSPFFPLHSVECIICDSLVSSGLEKAK